MPPAPQPAIAAPPLVAVVVPMLGPIELPLALAPVELPAPVALPQAPGLFFRPRHAQRHPRAAAKAPRRSGVLGSAVTLPAPPPPTAVTHPAPDRSNDEHRSVTHKAPPRETLSLILDSSFAPAPAGASAGGGGGGGGAAGSAAAVLSLWLLLQLPGFASLRLPARQRRPRARVDDMQTRPG